MSASVYEERKKLRKNLLEEIYNHYFTNGGAPYSITRSELDVDRNKKLALEYLKEKGYISAEPFGAQYKIKPTALGIDAVEN